MWIFYFSPLLPEKISKRALTSASVMLVTVPTFGDVDLQIWTQYVVHFLQESRICLLQLTKQLTVTSAMHNQINQIYYIWYTGDVNSPVCIPNAQLKRTRVRLLVTMNENKKEVIFKNNNTLIGLKTNRRATQNLFLFLLIYRTCRICRVWILISRIWGQEFYEQTCNVNKCTTIQS